MKTQKPIVALLGAIAFLAAPWVRAEIGIISPEDAQKLIENPDAKKRPIVLDTRGGYKDYFRGHLPFAHHLSFDTLRGTDKGVPVQYLPPDLTKALLVRAGVDKERTHIIYAWGEKLPNDEILSASMVAFVLEKYGIKDIKIVDGGFPAYKAAKLPWTQDYYGNPPGNLPKSGHPEIALTIDDVVKNKDKPGFVLVDARPIEEFKGEDIIWVRKGHIPGAISFHWARLMDSENTHKFKPFEEVKAELEAAGITKDKDVLCYCGTSREGSLLRFYLKYVAGYPKVRLYEGAWKEYAWVKNKTMPTETGGQPAGKSTPAAAVPIAPAPTPAPAAPEPPKEAAPAKPANALKPADAAPKKAE
jgi:thiosulfate/3-mercaptopyruvate sulfurtransferase